MNEHEAIDRRQDEEQLPMKEFWRFEDEEGHFICFQLMTFLPLYWIGLLEWMAGNYRERCVNDGGGNKLIFETNYLYFWKSPIKLRNNWAYEIRPSNRVYTQRVLCKQFDAPDNIDSHVRLVLAAKEWPSANNTTWISSFPLHFPAIHCAKPVCLWTGHRARERVQLLPFVRLLPPPLCLLLRLHRGEVRQQVLSTGSRLCPRFDSMRLRWNLHRHQAHWTEVTCNLKGI